jgi:hypothetical protein
MYYCFLAHSLAFDIKASSVKSNPLFHKSLKYSKIQASISGLHPFPDPEKDFIFVRYENRFLLNAASYVKRFLMGKN